MDKFINSFPAKPTRAQKRARIIMSEGSTVEYSSDEFAINVKTEAKRLALNRCWNCDAYRVEIAHIIAKEDSAVGLDYQCYESTNFMPEITLCSYLRYRFYIKEV